MYLFLVMETTRTPLEPDALPARPTIQEAAAFLKVSDKTVRNRLADGSLIGYRVGPRAIRIDRESLLALASRPLVPAAYGSGARDNPAGMSTDYPRRRRPCAVGDADPLETEMAGSPLTGATA